MIARFVTVSAVFLGLTVSAFAQQPAPASTDVPVGTAGRAADAVPADAPADPEAAPEAAPAPAESAAAAPRPPIVTLEDGPNVYRIGPEDVLDFHVWKNEELTRDRVPVRPDGRVSLPLVNDLMAAGLTPNELRAQYAARLAPFFQEEQVPEVSVTVREMNSSKVSVLGNVRMPGRYAVNSKATVLDMLALAQGLTEFADKGSIFVVRRSGDTTEQMEFKYDDAIRGREGANFFVAPGDVIIVR